MGKWLSAPNIISDKETGIGNFSDDMIVRAITEGVGADRRGLVMPWESFRRLTKEDLVSVRAPVVPDRYAERKKFNGQ